MKKKRVPDVADLIDDAVIMIADAMQGKTIPLKANELSIYLNMLVAIDKNNRDAVQVLAKNAPILNDQELDEKLNNLIKEFNDDKVLDG